LHFVFTPSGYPSFPALDQSDFQPFFFLSLIILVMFRQRAAGSVCDLL